MFVHRALVLTAAAVIAAQPLFAVEPASKGMSVSRAWARATPQGAKVGAAYMELRAGAETGDTLIAISSPTAGRVELHSSIEENGVMKMRRLDTLAIGAGETRALAPGGDHVMLFDLKGPLTEGGLLPLSLTFEKEGTINVEAAIEAVGAQHKE